MKSKKLNKGFGEILAQSGNKVKNLSGNNIDLNNSNNKDIAESLNKSLNKSLKMKPYSVGILSNEFCDIDLKEIKIPQWYGKKYISKKELNRAISSYEKGGAGNTIIVVRYLREEKKYELIDGLVQLKALLSLNIEVDRCKVIDDDNFDKASAMIASMSLNSREVLNDYESTIIGISFLIEKLNLKTDIEYIPIPSTGTSMRRTTTDIDKAIGYLANTRALRQERLKLTASDKQTSDDYEAMIEKITPEVEKVIDQMLNAIGVDLTTFLQKRIKLLDMPKNIVAALNEGKLHISKAKSISHIGTTREVVTLRHQVNSQEIEREIIRETEDVLKETIANNLTCKKVLELVGQANNRIYIKGTSDEEPGLSIGEVGERRRIKENVKLFNLFTKKLSFATKTVKDFEILSNLTDDEQSDIQGVLTKLENKLAKYKDRAIARMKN